MSTTKKVKCEGPGCEMRRQHHENDSPRGPQMLEVPEGFTGKCYCSIECYEYAKATKVESTD